VTEIKRLFADNKGAPLSAPDSFSDKILINKKIYNKVKSGKIKPTRVLDLHGLRYEEAKTRVIGFIISAYKSDHRLTLVITGKGKKTDITSSFFNNEDSGVLRRSLPSWLENKEIKSLILNVTVAHISHGGEGAFYVYLRKKRNHKT
jgi:DNA-nicking Smr family endonuclease